MYFLAIEITRRRLASTISFFALRAFASPIDIRRLTSLRSAIRMPTFFSSSRNLIWQLLNSSEQALRMSLSPSFFLRSLPMHLGSVSLPTKTLTKVFLGILAFLMQNSIISRSLALDSVTTRRMFALSMSIWRGTNLISRNSEEICFLSFLTWSESMPCFSRALINLMLLFRIRSKRILASSGSGPKF